MEFSMFHKISLLMPMCTTQSVKLQTLMLTHMFNSKAKSSKTCFIKLKSPNQRTLTSELPNCSIVCSEIKVTSTHLSYLKLARLCPIMKWNLFLKEVKRAILEQNLSMLLKTLLKNFKQGSILLEFACCGKTIMLIIQLF